ncbi:MAG: hypothetical protein RSB76_02790 [Clostridia bacterium]
MNTKNNEIKKILSTPVIWIGLISILNLLLYSLNFWTKGSIFCHIIIIISFILALIAIFYDPLKKEIKKKVDDAK